MDESNNVLVEDTENERTVAVYEWVEAAIFALVCVVRWSLPFCSVLLGWTGNPCKRR